jgi:hypothetical protein
MAQHATYESTWAGLALTGTSEKWAVFSTCGLYRYVLARNWSTAADYECMHVIMLNPSTATHEIDDPTIRRCIGFAKREGYGGLVIRNLFAYRTPYPAELMIAKDPVGPENAGVLAHVVDREIAIAAWGIVPPKLRKKMPPTPTVGACFGTTKEGWPKHPLYLKSDTPIRPAWRPA